MLLPFLRRLSVVMLLSSASISHAAVFNWADVAEGNGKCADTDIQSITSWLADAQTLINAALAATAERDTADEKILAFFTSYFGIEWDYSTPGAFKTDQSATVFAEVKSTLTDMNNFLAGNGLTEDAAGSPSAMDKTPYGYCGDDNFQYYSWDAQALFIDDVPVPNPDTGEPYSVAQIFQTFVGQYTPYWDKTEQGYAFSAGQPCSVETDTEGNTQVALAVVLRPYQASFSPITDVDEARLFGPSMAICDPLLTGTNLNDNYVESLADLTAAYPAAGSDMSLDSKIPKGAAIFHELTHLTTNYVKDQWYALTSCIQYAVIEAGSSTVSAQNNANSYMFFSLAVWYYYNPPGDYTATFYRGKANDPIRMASTS